jgi:hypothetical protein
VLVTSNDYEKVIRGILAEPGDASIAVAFWGLGSNRLLENRPDATRVICNLKSGATNPEPIKLLCEMTNVQLRQNDRLHAKVILGGGSALVGSANISSNGLNFEAEELRGWEEAGVLIKSQESIKAAKSWFDVLWSKSRPISDKDIEDAEIKWGLRRTNRGVAGKNLDHGVECQFDLGSLSAAELADRSVVVAIYKNWVSKEAEAAYRAEQNRLTGTPMAKSAKLPPMFENWPSFSKDTQIVDVYYEKPTVKCFGVFSRVFEIKFKYKDKTSGHLAICQKDGRLFGYTFADIDARRFASVLKPHIESIWNSEKAVGDESGRVVPLAEVARICG